MRKSNKIISLILVISLIFTMFPTQVFANEAASKMPDVVGNTEPLVKTEPNIIGEIVDKRDKNVKHYLKDNNTYEAVIYPTAVHYKENGKWKDVDNTLTEQTDTVENQQVLENKNNSYKVKFAKNSNASKLVKIKKDGYELSWGVENISESAVQIKAKDNEELSKLTANEQKMTLTNISSSIDYKDVFPNVDLNYDILPEQIKENIIIKSKTDNTVFRFKFNITNLIPELLPNNTIVFYDALDAKTKVFEIDAPYMFDAGNAESTDIKLQLEKGSDGKYIVTITPSKEWLNSEDRKYPVTVDPTVKTSVNEPAIIHDANVSENYPTTNYDQSFLLKTGTGSLSGKNKTYISFDLPQLNASDLVIKAELRMALAVTNDVAAGQVDVQKVNSSWNQTTITWNNQPNINSIVEDFKMVQEVWGKSFFWDITSIAKEWYSTGANNGLVLSNHTGSTGYNEYYSSNNGSTYASFRPYVSFTYVNSTGLEDYWTYHTQSAGRAGTGHVNNYNGNLVFVHDDMQTIGDRLPLGISHIYNSISNVDESGKDIGYGPGWRLNLSQTIISETIGEIQYYTYTDKDGTKHYFDQSQTSPYKDE